MIRVCVCVHVRSSDGVSLIIHTIQNTLQYFLLYIILNLIIYSTVQGTGTGNLDYLYTLCFERDSDIFLINIIHTYIITLVFGYIHTSMCTIHSMNTALLTYDNEILTT